MRQTCGRSRGAKACSMPRSRRQPNRSTTTGVCSDGDWSCEVQGSDCAYWLPRSAKLRRESLPRRRRWRSAHCRQPNRPWRSPPAAAPTMPSCTISPARISEGSVGLVFTSSDPCSRRHQGCLDEASRREAPSRRVPALTQVEPVRTPQSVVRRRTRALRAQPLRVRENGDDTLTRLRWQTTDDCHGQTFPPR